MGLTSLQVCMDSVDWLQGAIQEDSGIDSSSPSGEMLTCSRPLMERRLRPQHDQALKCPRCDSTHTKFCYYNNYSLSQPRYFCKTCRRYWTKGGTLRNIPVGGGCRKNKKVASKKPSDPHQSINHNYPGSSSTDLHLSFPDHQMQFSHLNNMLGNDHHHGSLGNPSFMLENPRNYDFMGNGDHLGSGILAPNFHNFCSPFGVNSLDGTFMDTCQRLMLPYHDQETEDQNAVEVKPNTRLLSLEHWQDQGQGCSDAGKDTFGYINNVGSWTGMMNGYGQSATNPLV